MPEYEKISLEKVLHALETLEPIVEIDEQLRIKAMKPLNRMLELAK